MNGLKILVVDDQPAVLAALEVLFDVHGFETVAARTPEQALGAVRSEELGVVLQDMNFHRDATSGEEGEALLHAIRKLDPALPVVLMTAFQSLESAVRRQTLGRRQAGRHREELDATSPAFSREPAASRQLEQGPRGAGQRA
jgi:DNA-binding NtrC family response regulator